MVEVRSSLDLVLALALAPVLVLVHWSRTHQLVLDYTALYVKSSWCQDSRLHSHVCLGDEGSETEDPIRVEVKDGRFHLKERAGI